MDIFQSVCRSAATSSARPSLLLAAASSTSQFSRITATSLFLQPNRQFSASRASLDASDPSSARPQRAVASGLDRLRQTIRQRKPDSSSLPPRPPSAEPGTLLDETSRPQPPKAFSIEDLPGQINADANKSLQYWKEDEFLARHEIHAKKEVNLRLRPSTGRTVNVSGSVDAFKALRMLDTLVKRNSVYRDFKQQLFHERPALKRKRQWRERWRQRFQGGVRAAIHRTMQLRHQGW